MSQQAEVVVVGGGLAGCCAALGLAHRGHLVRVLERQSLGREKVCGEGLMPHGVEALRRLGIDVQGIPFRGIGYTVDDARAVADFPDGLTGLGVRRRDLDAMLLRAVQSHPNIQLDVNSRVRKVTGTPGAMVVHAEAEIRARAVVVADGLNSPLRKQLGLEKPRTGRPRYGARRHYLLAPGKSEGERVEVIALRGYELYITPTGVGEVNVAVLLESQAAKSLKGNLGPGLDALMRQSPRVQSLLEGATPITDPMLCGPLRRTSKARAAPGVVLVGDAGGFLDGITGEGMALSALGAEIAVDVLSASLHSGDLSARTLMAYDRRYSKRARQVIWLTEIILWGIRHRRLARQVVRNLGKHPELFGQVLAVNVDRAPLSSVGVTGVLRLLTGL